MRPDPFHPSSDSQSASKGIAVQDQRKSSPSVEVQTDDASPGSLRPSRTMPTKDASTETDAVPPSLQMEGATPSDTIVSTQKEQDGLLVSLLRVIESTERNWRALGENHQSAFEALLKTRELPTVDELLVPKDVQGEVKRNHGWPAAVSDFVRHIQGPAAKPSSRRHPETIQIVVEDGGRQWTSAQSDYNYVDQLWEAMKPLLHHLASAEPSVDGILNPSKRQQQPATGCNDTPLAHELLSAVEASKEMFQRVTFESQSLSERIAEEGAEGNVDQCELLGKDRIHLLTGARDELCRVLEMFPPVVQSLVDEPSKALKKRVSECKANLLSLLDIINGDLDAANQRERDAQTAWCERRDNFYLKHIRLTQQIADCSQRFELTKSEIGRLWSNLLGTATQLFEEFRRHAAAASDAIELVSEKRLLIDAQDQDDCTVRMQLDVFQHHQFACKEMQSTLQGILQRRRTQMSGNSRAPSEELSEEATQGEDTPKLTLQYLEELESRALMAFQKAFFEEKIHLHELHHKLWRDVCLATGDIEWRKKAALLALEDKVAAVRMELEIAQETLDPKAKEVAIKRNTLEEAAKALQGEVDGLSLKITEFSENFVRLSQPALLESGRALEDPREELKLLNEKRSAKLGNFKQQLLLASREEEVFTGEVAPATAPATLSSTHRSPLRPLEPAQPAQQQQTSQGSTANRGAGDDLD